eukprot:snap_masked-scaffold_3-processed-gene-6.39-mRNA-1 protein AED:1.00 eAED:1.00 QI:0/-1/0/0/-1/1/1/0/65
MLANEAQDSRAIRVVSPPSKDFTSYKLNSVQKYAFTVYTKALTMQKACIKKWNTSRDQSSQKYAG